MIHNVVVVERMKKVRLILVIGLMNQNQILVK